MAKPARERKAASSSQHTAREGQIDRVMVAVIDKYTTNDATEDARGWGQSCSCSSGVPSVRHAHAGGLSSLRKRGRESSGGHIESRCGRVATNQALSTDIHAFESSLDSGQQNHVSAVGDSGLTKKACS